MRGLKMNKTSNERIYEVIRSPLVSEKSTFISQFNYYVFKVSPNSTKMEIKNAVENIGKIAGKLDKLFKVDFSNLDWGSLLGIIMAILGALFKMQNLNQELIKCLKFQKFFFFVFFRKKFSFFFYIFFVSKKNF